MVNPKGDLRQSLSLRVRIVQKRITVRERVKESMIIRW